MIRFDRNNLRLHCDGHGLNHSAGEDVGMRLITFQKRHKDHGGGYVVADREDRMRIGAMLADAPAALNSVAELIETFAPNVDMTLRNGSAKDCTPAVARALELLQKHGMYDPNKQG